MSLNYHAFVFASQDLVEEDVMILDTFSEVYVWVGRGSNQVEKKEALKSAKEYITTDPSGRDIDSTSLVQVKQGFEPPTFRCHYLGWNPSLWEKDDSYESYRKQVSIESVYILLQHMVDMACLHTMS